MADLCYGQKLASFRASQLILERGAIRRLDDQPAIANKNRCGLGVQTKASAIHNPLLRTTVTPFGLSAAQSPEQSKPASIDADHAGTENHRCWYARKKRRRERKSSLTSARPRRLKINADSNTPTKIVSPNSFDAPRDGSIRPIAIIVIKAPMPLERQPATDFSLRDAPWTISAPQPEHIDALESTTLWQCGQTKSFTKIILSIRAKNGSDH